MSEKIFRVHLIANTKSGKGNGATVPELAQKLCDELGYQLVVYAGHDGVDFNTEIQRAVQGAKSDNGIVIAAGGDGTIRSAAQVAVAEDVRFGAVATGTFNYFARGHGISEEPEEALRTALTGREKHVHLGEVNGKVFLINASMGLYAKSIINREKHTSRFGRHRLVAIISTVLTLLSRHRNFHVDLSTRDKKMDIKTPMIFVGNNDLQLRNLSFDVADCIKQGKLAVVMFKHVSRFSIFKIIYNTFVGKIDAEENVEMFCIQSMTINTKRKSHNVALDGEIFHMQAPLVVKTLPRALRLMVGG